MAVKEIVVDQPGSLWDFLSNPCYYGAARTGSRRWEVHTPESDHDYFIESGLFHTQCPGFLERLESLLTDVTTGKAGSSTV